MDRSTINTLIDIVKLEFANFKHTLYQKPKEYIFSFSKEIEFYKTWFSLIIQEEEYINDMLELNGIDEGSLIEDLNSPNFLDRQYGAFRDLIEPVPMDYDGILSSLETYFNYQADF